MLLRISNPLQGVPRPGIILVVHAMLAYHFTTTTKQTPGGASRTAERAPGERVYVDPSLIEPLHRVGPRHYARLIIFVAMYFGTACGAFLLAQESRGSPWTYLANIPLYLV